MTDRERTITKLALIAARITIKESLRNNGIKIAYVASTDIDATAKALYDSDPNAYTKAATEFYNEFEAIGKTSKMERVAS